MNSNYDDSKIYFNKVFSKLKREFRHKDCFHKDNNCSSPIIKAHSIQNHRILNRILDKDKVMNFGVSTLSDDDLFSMTQKGINIVTTFPGFCNYHDSQIFKPVEEHDYLPGTKEQEYLFAYRSLAKEYFDKMSDYIICNKMLKMHKDNDFETIRKYFPNTEPNKISCSLVSRYYNEYKRGVAEAVKRNDKLRIAMNINLDKKRYYKISTNIIKFKEEYPIAASSTFCIEYDLKGNQINEINRANSYVAPLYLTVFPQNGETYVLLSTSKYDVKIYESLLKEIINSNLETQKVIISNMILIYVENFVLSPVKWDRYSKEIQKDICSIFRKTIRSKPNKLLSYPNINLFN